VVLSGMLTPLREALPWMPPTTPLRASMPLTSPFRSWLTAPLMLSRTCIRGAEIAAPLAKVGDTISGAVSKLKGGDASGITDANSSIDGIKSSSASNGVAVKDNPNANLNG